MQDKRQKLADAISKAIVAVLDYHSEEWDFQGLQQDYIAEPVQNESGHVGTVRTIRLDFEFFQPAPVRAPVPSGDQTPGR